MAGKVEVEVAGLRSTASGLDDAAARIRAILAGISAKAQASDGCWGDDEFGRPFAEGDKGYKANNEALQGVLGKQAKGLETDAGGLRDGATALETAENNNTDSF